MKILITGANGLLGQKLIEAFADDSVVEIIATSRGESRLGDLPSHIRYHSLDITDEDEVINVTTKYNPDIVIHTAAMTNVDQCEEDKKECWKLNVDAVSYLVKASEQYDAFFIHLSTDFIFDGEEEPLTEEAVPSPVNYYGESKLAAEKLVMKSKVSWAIARTILIYGVTPRMSRSNIILWVKSSLEKGETINVVNDQWRTPTLAEDLAQGCMLIARQKAEGVFNISGKDFLTPYEMAIQTAEYFDLDKSQIVETDGSKFKQRAKRPARTRFVIDKAREQLGYNPKSFREGIAIVANQVGEH